MERITLEEAHVGGYPVVKRTAIGQLFVGAIIKSESRNRLKRGDDGQMTPIIKPSGKAAQEMVVTCVTMPGTTAPAGLGDEESVPNPGDIVRLILKGKSFGDWIDGKKALPNGTVAVGDVVTQTTKSAQVYDAAGNASGPELTDQAAVNDARQRGRTVGIYGPLTLALPTDDAWAKVAVEAYRNLPRPTAEDGAPATPAAAAPAPAPQMQTTQAAPPAPIQTTQADPAAAALVRPPSITEAAWNLMDEATKTTIVASVPPY